MKKWNKDYRQGFLRGLLVPTLVLALLGSALAATGTMQQIDALVGGISIYVDGVLQEPKNVKGEAVQPIAWQGTTYLPVRALTNMLTDKEVNWDQSTMSVYIGKQPAKPLVKLNELEMYQKNSEHASMTVDSYAAFSKLDKKVEAYNRLILSCNSYETGSYYSGRYRQYEYSTKSGTGYAVYMLDSKYKALTGKLDVPYSELGDKGAVGVAFYSVDAYGEENLIDKFFVKAGDQSVDVSVPLTGVEILKIERIGTWDEDWPYDQGQYNCGKDAYLYNVALETY